MLVDSRIYDMLELYKHKNEQNMPRNQEKVCLDTNYCIPTDYNPQECNVLTMAFVNMQPIETVYETEQGFCKGTIFPNIDKPFYGGKKYE